MVKDTKISNYNFGLSVKVPVVSVVGEATFVRCDEKCHEVVEMVPVMVVKRTVDDENWYVIDGSDSGCDPMG